MLLLQAKERLARAETHLEHVKTLLPRGDSFANVSAYGRIETQPDGKTHDVFVKVLEPSLEFRMGIGDVVHDLRTSLDYVAYQLAIRNGFPSSGRTPDQLRDLRKLNFLIHSDEHRFRSAAGNVKPIIGIGPVDAMERLQTYKGADTRAPSLFKLSELDNITKHRMIAVVYQRLAHAEVEFVINEKHVARGRLLNPDRLPSEDGAKLFSFVFDQPPVKVDLSIDAVQEVVFTDTDGICDGENVIGLLRECATSTAGIINEFERMFFS